MCTKMGCFKTDGSGAGDELDEQKRVNREIERELNKHKQEYRSTHRLLLLGNTGYSYYSSVIIDSASSYRYK